MVASTWPAPQQKYALQQMHWDIAKLLELGVDERFLEKSNITPDQARDLVKGLLYLKEHHSDYIKRQEQHQ